MKRWMIALFFLMQGLTACALYHPKPLAETPSFLGHVPHVTVSADRLSLPELRNHPFNPDDGLDMTEVAILAVVNNPDLRAQRDGRGIARAQLLAAGVLPNPQVTAGLDHPTTSGPGLVNAFTLGLSYDFGALVTRPAALGAARAVVDKIDWGMLWQEWQVVQKARLLFIQITEQEKIYSTLKQFRDLLTERVRRASAALSEGNLTLDTLTANLTELQGVESRLHELNRKNRQERQDLNALTGVAPAVQLPLTDNVHLPDLTAAQVAAALKQLPQRRPDLLALQAGYTSQEQLFRQAVLAQFPSLNLGLTRARDTSGINTFGFGVTMTLPVFDRNQGAIAITRATRRQLYDEYQARLNAVWSEVAALAEQIRLTDEQRQAVLAALPQMETVARRAKAALDIGGMEIVQFIGIQSALFEKQIEAQALEQSLLEQRTMLLTLLGNDFSGRNGATQIHPVTSGGEVK
ncbi:MAG: TolC family protein [Desulfuromonadaceae bacterium]|nr:TolC family protein [Desulfuromonadaceae bacterium]